MDGEAEADHFTSIAPAHNVIASESSSDAIHIPNWIASQNLAMTIPNDAYSTAIQRIRATTFVIALHGRARQYDVQASPYQRSFIARRNSGMIG